MRRKKTIQEKAIEDFDLASFEWFEDPETAVLAPMVKRPGNPSPAIEDLLSRRDPAIRFLEAVWPLIGWQLRTAHGPEAIFSAFTVVSDIASPGFLNQFLEAGLKKQRFGSLLSAEKLWRRPQQKNTSKNRAIRSNFDATNLWRERSLNWTIPEPNKKTSKRPSIHLRSKLPMRRQ